MKSFGFLLFALLIAQRAFAELDTLWSREVFLNGQAYDISAATVLNDGGVAATTVTYPSPTDSAGLRIWRFGLNGDLLWERDYGAGVPYLQVIGIEEVQGGTLVQFIVASQLDNTVSLITRGYNSQGDSLWQRDFTFPWLDANGEVILLEDGNLIVATSSWDSLTGTSPLLIKCSAEGDTMWSRRLDDCPNCSARAVTELPNGNLVMALAATDESGFSFARALCVTVSVIPVWSVDFEPGDFGINVTSISSDAAGNIVMTGSVGGWQWFDTPWAVGLSSTGDERWMLNPNQEDLFTPAGCLPLPDGGAVLVSTRWPDFGFPAALIHSVDADGNLTQEADFSGSPSGFSGLRNCGARGATAFGYVSGEDWQNAGFLLRFGPSTTVTGFVRHLGTNSPLEGVRVEAVETGEFTLTDAQGIYTLPVSNDTMTLRVISPCIEPLEQVVYLEEGEQNTRNFSVGMPEYGSDPTSLNMVATYHMIARDTITIYNSGNGDLIFTVEANEQDPDYDWLSVNPASGVLAPEQGTFIEVLALPTQPEWSDHFGEVRIHHNHCPDSVDEIGVYMIALDSPRQPGAVEKFAVHPAFPNPFNAETSIRFDLPRDAHVKAALYSITGQSVAELADEVNSAGSHTLHFTANALASGIYLLRVQAADFVSTQKLVLLK